MYPYIYLSGTTTWDGYPVFVVSERSLVFIELDTVIAQYLTRNIVTRHISSCLLSLLPKKGRAFTFWGFIINVEALAIKDERRNDRLPSMVVIDSVLSSSNCVISLTNCDKDDRLVIVVIESSLSLFFLTELRDERSPIPNPLIYFAIDAISSKEKILFNILLSYCS